MTNFNTCEKEHGDPEGFLREVAAVAAAERHISGTPATHEISQQNRPFSFAKVMGLELRQPFPDITVLAQPGTHRLELHRIANAL